MAGVPGRGSLTGTGWAPADLPAEPVAKPVHLVRELGLARPRALDDRGRCLGGELVVGQPRTGRLEQPPGVGELLLEPRPVGVCGGGMVVETSGRKTGRVPQYVCNRYMRQGTCTNSLRADMADANEAVLRAIEACALTPEAVEHVVALSERDEVRDRQKLLEREAADVEKRIKRLVSVIANGEDVFHIMAPGREEPARLTPGAVLQPDGTLVYPGPPWPGVARMAE